MTPEWEVDLGMGVHHHTPTTMPPPPPASSISHFYGGGDLSFFPPGGAAAAAELPPASGSFNLSFADDFSIPMQQSEEAAELEWLSNFIDDSYPDMPNYPPEVVAAAAQQNSKPSSSSSAATSTGTRTKRSRGTSWLLPSPSSSSSSSNGGKKGQQPPPAPDTNSSEVRRCTHCASEKTPQWRTGPLGPKTLCNACGVRYKSGRLVPEYRPAASPTFVLTQHSNSHRKVMELRRQKELLHLRGASPSSSSAAFRDYGVC